MTYLLKLEYKLVKYLGLSLYDINNTYLSELTFMLNELQIEMANEANKG